jgi:hypothetical protein
MLLHVIISLWSHPSIPMMGSKESGALNSPEHLSQEPHYIHDETIDEFPGTGLNDILLEDNVSIVPNTKELFEEQDEKENVEAEAKIMLLSPTEEVLQVWKHHSIALWSPLLQDIICGLQFPVTNISCQLPNLYHTY